MTTKATIATMAGVVALGLGAPVAADRALGPTDTLEAGTVEVGASVSSQRRELSLTELLGTTDTTSRSADTELFARAWLSDNVWLAASQGAFFFRSAEDNFGEIPVDESGLSVLAVSGGVHGQLGSLRLGGSTELSLPNGTGFDIGRLDATARGIVAVPTLRGGELFAIGAYTARFGDSFTDVPDGVAGTAGYHQRIGNLSVIPSVGIERLLSDSSEEEAFSTVRAGLLAGYELVDDVSLVARVDVGWAREHAVGIDSLGSGRELSATTSVVYAWDSGPMAKGAVSAPDPATIRVSEVDGGEPVEQALRKRVPALRLATLKAERNAGGVNGTMRVTLQVGSDGHVQSSDVIDGTGAQKLADAVQRYWRGAKLQGLAPQTVAFTLAFDSP